MTMLEAALKLALADGYPVLPCARDKSALVSHPDTPGKGGLHLATTDPDQIRAWWTRWPGAGIGVNLGMAGLAVVDVDGPEALDDLEALNLPATWRVKTARGEHLYFHVPAGETLGCAKLGAALDLKGDGGYVMAPPTVHASGVVYTPANDTPIHTLTLAELERIRAAAGSRRNGNGAAPPIGPEIPSGERNQTLASLAGTMRRRGMGEAAILAALKQTNTESCKPPLADHDVAAIASSVGRYEPENATNGTGPEHGAPTLPPLGPVRIVSLEDFIAVHEDGAEPLVGEPGAILIPQAGDVMIYGDGGAGKTTLGVDLACHLATGTDWLGVAINTPVRVLIVENEGPRALFRDKLRRKLEGWPGTPIPRGSIAVWETPWAELRFDSHDGREALAAAIREHETDVIIIGPVTAAGMEAAGTIQDVRKFAALTTLVRELAGRPVTFILIHHESKSGAVSGAWEGVGDTLLHASQQGNGRTRLHIQKARWSSLHHGTTMQLAWAPGEGFELVDAPPSATEDEIATQILADVATHPGTGWTRVEQATPGINAQSRRGIRDQLLRDGKLVNIGKDEDGLEGALNYVPDRKPARLYLPDDHPLTLLRPASDADGTQQRPAGVTQTTPLQPDPAHHSGGGE